MQKTHRLKSATPVRPDGRETLVTYLHPNLKKELKKAALDEKKHAYEIVEQAVHNWLAAREAKWKRKAK